jgi:prepilin-type processing-associated H-X9-DG protein
MTLPVSSNYNAPFVFVPATGTGQPPKKVPGNLTCTGVIWVMSQTSMRSITDGTSKVYLIGEKYLDQNDYINCYSGSGDEEFLYTGFDDDLIRLGSSGGVYAPPASGASVYSPYIYPPQQDNAQWPFLVSTSIRPTTGTTDAFNNYRFGSAHSVGFNMAFCDGSVHIILYTIDAPVHAMLSNRMDGQTIDATMYVQ